MPPIITARASSAQLSSESVMMAHAKQVRILGLLAPGTGCAGLAHVVDMMWCHSQARAVERTACESQTGAFQPSAADLCRGPGQVYGEKPDAVAADGDFLVE